jgi:hypothetical protein
MGEGSLHASSGTLVGVVLGPSSVPPSGCGGGSMKNKATRILADASRVISLCMRRSFIDRGAYMYGISCKARGCK